MADEYVSQVSLAVNGQEITDFKKVVEKKYTLRKQVKLMRKRGYMKVTPEYSVDVDYVVPLNSPEFDFDAIVDATLTLTYDNGLVTTYTGVCTLEVADQTYDEENELVRTVTLGATGRIR